MLSFFFGLFFVAIMLLLISLQRSYSHYSLKELKRQARAHDQVAELLHRAASYGLSVHVLLYSLITFSAALAFVLLAQPLETWFAVLLIAFFIWFGFLWLPHARVSAWSERLIRWTAPAIAWLTRALNPILRRVGSFLYRNRHLSVRTQLYEKEDLVELLQRQSDQPDNRISTTDIDLTIHALTFNQQLVDEVLVPRRVVKLVTLNEAIGPKLMDELYQSGYSRFPVTAEDTDTIVGTLYMKDLVKRTSGGHVRDVVRPDVYYIHEDFSLSQALAAFLKTKHHLFIVVNSFEEFVGIVTIEDVIEALIGKQIVDEFDAYDDMRAVAKQAAQKDHAAHTKSKQSIESFIAPEE